MGNFIQLRQSRLKEEVQSRKLLRVAPTGREKADVEWSLAQLGVECLRERTQTGSHTISVYGELAHHAGRMVVVYDEEDRVRECWAFPPRHVDEIEWEES
ncbi:hypothetical protein [Laceyella putida]|uniref:Uncharacterized protein n=1 Tax=Laceyella putida TaxID=110101 RepID=A0ABW2RLW6_9BACL